MPDEPRQLALFAPPDVQPQRQPEAPRGRVRPRRQPPPQLELPLQRGPRLLAGGGDGSGHRRGRLTALSGGRDEAPPLPGREEITAILLGAFADLVAGRISPTAAAAIRGAAEEALRRLDEAQRDPHRTPLFVRAARALQELVSVRVG